MNEPAGLQWKRIESLVQIAIARALRALGQAGNPSAANWVTYVNADTIGPGPGAGFDIPTPFATVGAGSPGVEITANVSGQLSSDTQVGLGLSIDDLELEPGQITTCAASNGFFSLSMTMIVTPDPGPHTYGWVLGSDANITVGPDNGLITLQEKPEQHLG